MSDTPPPPQYVAYPRGNPGPSYGTVEQLQALGDGYFGLNWSFLGAIVLSLLTYGAVVALGQLGLIASYVLVFAGVAYLSYSPNKKIAYGIGWPESKALTASILMGLVAIVCCGIIGFVVMQSIAMKEMRKYGIKGGFTFGKKAFRAAVEARRSADFANPPTGFIEPPK